jgi:hypothetical protein
MKMFGEVGVVSTKKKIQSKLASRGMFLFVGYTENHSHDMLRMLNLETHTIIHARDIIWINKTYKDWVIDRSRTSMSNEDAVIELPTGIDICQVYDNRDNVEVVDDNNVKTHEKVLLALKKLKCWFNPQARKTIDNCKEGQEIPLEQANLALCSTSKV